MRRRVLIVLETRSLPGATVRGLQFKDLFERHPHFDATFVWRTSDFLNRVLRRWPHRPLLRWPIQLLNRAIIRYRENRIISRARGFDLVYVLTVPSERLHERLCELPDTRVVVDLLDALWLPWFRQFGWQHLEETLARVDGVICENRWTAAFARKHNDRVFIVPDAPQLDIFDAWRPKIRKSPDEVTLGWIGGPNTVDSLYAILEPLERLFSRRSDVHLRILGAPRDRLPRFEKVRFSVLESYDQATMVTEALKMHVGLYPQFDTEESLNRGTLKAKVYMSAEAVAVCQNLGENPDLISDGVNGVLASTRDQWLSKLEWLAENPEQRETIATQGLKTIREHFTAEKCFQRLLEAFEEMTS